MSGQYLASVELLFLKTINAGWIIGPSMSLTVVGSTMQSFQNGVILIGGRGQVFPVLPASQLKQYFNQLSK
jgi:hypothetical protein